ncbi:MAG: ATP-binding cassette domain-containing protein [Pseudomonadota bacterium]
MERTVAVARPGAQVVDLDLASVEVGGAPVLGQIRLLLHAGECLAILGPSGIGKTTLLRVIAGLEPGITGRRNVTAASAMVFQEPTLLPWRSARENVTILSGCAPEDAKATLSEVGLADKEDLFPHQLSLGQQRRLSLARAIATKPDLLLLDEPFVSLDHDLVEDMLALFAALFVRRNLAAILVTHDEAEAQALATRILSLGGKPAEILGERHNVPRPRLR